MSSILLVSAGGPLTDLRPVNATLPEIAVQGGGAPDPGVTLEISVEAVFTDADTLEYQFYREGVAVGDPGDATLTYETSLSDNGATYTVRATAANEYGSRTVESAGIEVGEPSAGFARITQASNTRITQAGNFRVLQAAA